MKFSFFLLSLPEAKKMKIRLIIPLLFAFISNCGAQCCCGRFYFRIYDPQNMLIHPMPADTSFLKNSGSTIEKEKLNGGFSIKTKATEGNAGIASIVLEKKPFPELLFEFDTGCSTELKKISSKKGKMK